MVISKACLYVLLLTVTVLRTTNNVAEHSIGVIVWSLLHIGAAPTNLEYIVGFLDTGAGEEFMNC